MLVTVVINILNIIGNYSLIFGKFGFPELGVEGAVISTAFSRECLWLFCLLFCSANISIVSLWLISGLSLL